MKKLVIAIAVVLSALSLQAAGKRVLPILKH